MRPFISAMYVIFRGVESNIFDDPVEAMMGMFIMSLGEFADIYESFSRTPMQDLPKVVWYLKFFLCNGL